MKKILVLLLAVCMTLTTVGCNNENQEDYGDKLVLNVFNYNGGFGTDWLYEAAERFEELYKDEVFAEGYKGVKIVPDPVKSASATLQDSILSSADDVFFTEIFLAKRYYDQNALLDISDIVNEPLTKYGESKSIADKMYEEDKTYYSYNGNYYGIPHYEGYMGISYNIDIFEKELCYFKQGGGFITSLSDTKASGPDGKAGTYDDGLPATMDQFIELCARLKGKGISPISWAGDCQFYFTRFLSSLWANEAGADNIKLMYSMDGQASGIATEVDSNGTPKFLNPQPYIDNTNGYLVQTHIGKYYALDLAEKIIDNGYYSANTFGETQTNLMAQADMLYSDFDPEDEISEKIAMYVDGNYWYNEAKLTFEEMEEYYGESASMKNRRFAYMPFPHAKAEDVGKKNVLVDDLNSVGMIKANIEPYKIKAAKAFLQFCYTDKSLQEFTTITGAMKGVKYELTSSQISSMNSFYQSVHNVRQNSDVVKTVSDNSIFFNNAEGFFFGDYMSTKVKDKTPYNVPSKAMKDSNVSAIDYYNGMKYKYTKSDWISRYQQYFVD